MKANAIKLAETQSKDLSTINELKKIEINNYFFQKPQSPASISN